MKQLLIVNSAKALNAGITSTADLSGLEEGAITFINPKSTTPISAKPTENFAIALGRANGQLPFMISEVDVKSLVVTKATPVTGVALKRTFTVPIITAGKEMGVMLIKKGSVPHERNTWTAVVTATGTPATDAAAIKKAIDDKVLPFTVTVASAKVTITAISTKDLWEVKLTDELRNVAFSTTSGETADPVIPTGDKAYIEKLASMCAAGKGFNDTDYQGREFLPGYPETVENTTYNVYTLRFAVPRASAKTRDEVVNQLVHIAVPTTGSGASARTTAIETILGLVAPSNG